MNKCTVNIAILGLGTVGTGVVNLINKQKVSIKKRTGVDLQIKAISAKSRRKKRAFDLKPFKWVNNPLSLAKDKDIDVIVELIGDDDGLAKRVIEAGIKEGKHIVTANKALLANQGEKLAILAKKHKVSLKFEAAVAGGIPIIKVLSESLISNKLDTVYGVINGTCNYILTKMEAESRTYCDVFLEAQKMGYVEADPNLDIGGIDTAHKLSIISALAFGTKIDYENVLTKGIKDISLEDVQEAETMGYRIKLLAKSEYKKGLLHQEVAPCLVEKNNPIAQVNGSTNIITIEGEDIGETVFSGPGAGMGPTASAVVSDLISLSKGYQSNALLTSFKSKHTVNKDISLRSNSFYIRFQLKDKSGVIALLSTKLSSNKISINQMKQKALSKGKASLIITTHKTSQKNLEEALGEIKRSKICFSEPVSIRIQDI